MKRQSFGTGWNAVETLLFLLTASFITFSIISLFIDDFDIVLRKYFYFSTESFLDLLIWTPLSYTFLHDGPYHLILNLLFLFFFGRLVEPLIGSYNVYCLFIIGSLLGSVFWACFNPQAGYLVGASAGVMALVSYFCIKQPDKPITLLLFFILPFTIKPRWILIAALLYDGYGLLFNEINELGAIAHSAHLGGIAAGALVFLFLQKGYEFPRFVFKFTSKKAISIFRRQNSNLGKNSLDKSNYKVNFTNTTDLQKEVDRILDKINEFGFGSLTQDEKLTLEKAKGLLRN